MIKGRKVHLIPATLSDRPRIFDWCYRSETTACHSGPPDYTNNPIPTYEEFFSSDDGGYEEYYFTGERPQDGRGYIIVYGDEPIGFISYCAFHLKPGIAELDIWMPSESTCGKGLGPDAMIALGDYLRAEMGFDELIIAPSVKNTRAVRAYEKAGFRRTDRAMTEFLSDEYASQFGDGDYGADETAILVKRLTI